MDLGAIERVRTRLLARQDDWRGVAYEEARAKVRLMMRLKFDEGTIVTEARRWMQAGGTLDQVPAADLSFPIVQRIFSDAEVINGEFSVEWNGFLKPSATGAYQLLISPINVASGNTQNLALQKMTVSVNGNAVLKSSPDDAAAWDNQSEWVSQSNVINLTADQPVALKVNYSVNIKKDMPSGTLHAMLFWKQPGNNTPEIVPSTNLVLPDNSGRGLKAAYAWSLNGQARKLTRTDSNIDFAWTTSPVLLSADATSSKQYGDSIWSSLTSPAFLTASIGSKAAQHPFLKYPNDSAAVLTTSQRSSFLDKLIQQPSLLDSTDTKEIVRFFQAFRIGTQDKAVDVFGVWASRHANLVCDFSIDRVYNGDQRYAFGILAIFTTQQQPGQIATLQSKYLQLPDGSCSLPVAYTLACSYLGRNKYDDWLALLDAKVADTSLKGDARVSWLIARANADELNPLSSTHYPFYYSVPSIDPFRAQPTLDKALKAAQSPATKVQVAQEIVGRMAWARDFVAAKAVLQKLASGLPSEQQTVVANLQSQFDGFIVRRKADLEKQPELAKQAHLTELRRRRDQAAKQGDAASVSRYDNLIETVSAAQ